jgi:signal transduction histidine kinase
MKSRTAVIAIIALVLIATVSAILTVRMTARAIDDTAVVQAAEAPEIARLYIAKYGSLAAAAPSIVTRIERYGLHVLLFDKKTLTWYNGRGPERERRFSRAREGDVRGGPGPRSIGAPPTMLGLGPSGEGLAGPPGPPPRRAPGWVGIVVTTLAGADVHRTRIPGGVVAIFPEPEPILIVLRTVSTVLAFIMLCSGAILWLYVRGVRRAALRPLHQTTLALQRLALRDFSPRTIVAEGDGTYDELARAYNAAVEAVSSAFAERRAAEIEMQRFIADAGHELRTPLTIVMGYLDIIDAGALNDPQLVNRITSGMRTESARMRKLIDKLIILARMETPSDIDIRTNIDVVALVARIIESLEPLTVQPMHVTGLTFAHVFANEDDIAEALTNIIENAIKYAPLSPIRIGIERAEQRIVIAIADRGPGMSTEEQQNAFERFYRGDQGGEVSGSGLGLAIAKRGIERARGTIRLDSAIGHGTTFTIELPEMPISLPEGRSSSNLTRR